MVRIFNFHFNNTKNAAVILTFSETDHILHRDNRHFGNYFTFPTINIWLFSQRRRGLFYDLSQLDVSNADIYTGALDGIYLEQKGTFKMPIKQAPQVYAHHVEEAAKFWNLNPGYKCFRDSTTYDVIINGEPFPPKAIISISHELAKLGDMPPSSFAGAKDGKWHEMLKNLGFRIVPKGVVITESQEIGESASIHADIEDIEDEYRDNPTRQATLVLARLGQGKYRKELLSLWDNRCAVTGCSVLPVLRASHAKPWCKSSDKERLDPNNGIPLVATLDALFDAGLIGFDDKGHMHVSKKLRDEELLKGVPNALRKKPTAAQAGFLKEHLSSIFQTDDF